MSDFLFAPSKAADVLGVSRATLYRLIQSGELQAIRVGRVLRVEPADLARYKAAHRVQVAPLPSTRTPRTLPAVVASDQLGTDRYT